MKKREEGGEVIMCCETTEARERKNPVQQNQPSNKHAPVMGQPKPKGAASQELPHPPCSL